MARIGVSDARDHLSDVVDQVHYTADRIGCVPEIIGFYITSKLMC